MMIPWQLESPFSSHAHSRLAGLGRGAINDFSTSGHICELILGDFSLLFALVFPQYDILNKKITNRKIKNRKYLSFSFSVKLKELQNKTMRHYYLYIKKQNTKTSVKMLLSKGRDKTCPLLVEYIVETSKNNRALKS